MRILIANDDGIYSPGLLALAEVAREFADVRIFAPDVEQSSMGHAITHSRPLSLRRTPIRDFEAYRVNGTPADCVALGVYMWDKVDLVLSGINLGPQPRQRHVALGHPGRGQAGGAARAARHRLQHAHAGSEPDFTRLRLRGAGPGAADRRALPLPRECQSPAGALGSLLGAPIGTALRRARWFRGRTDGEKALLADRRAGRGCGGGTDRWAVERGLVSITPLRLDLTDADALARLREEHPLGGP